MEKTVRFEAGARIHFHDNSGLIAAQSSSVHVLGKRSADPESLEGEVVFEGDRLEPFFENIPGQWGAIWLTAGSTNHIFRHATIKNASVGKGAMCEFVRPPNVSIKGCITRISKNGVHSAHMSSFCP